MLDRCLSGGDEPTASVEIDGASPCPSVFAANGGGRPKSGALSLKAQGQGEIELARQAETAYRRLAKHWQQTAKGTDATRGRASSKPSSGKQRGRASVPNPAL